ncbi:MAG TPA: hypothetical protein VF184_04940 [Phycisphaeraceae bacterium]
MKLIITTPTRDLDEFRSLAQFATRLRRHGRVEVNVGALAQKMGCDTPGGQNSWHAYTAFNPALERFAPAPQITPFLPAKAVAANRSLLLAKTAILSELGLGAAFWNYLPNYLPEAFFEAYPEWRGPRTDHPRRSRQEAYAPCVDRPEVLAMIHCMAADLLKLAPDIGTFYFKTNDAGPGLCWSDWQYAGPNGPTSCRHRCMGQRVRGLVEAIQQGAAEARGAVDVFFSGNFSVKELDDIARELPARAGVRGRTGAPLTLGTLADACYPVRGIFDPLGALQGLQALRDAQPPAIFIDLRCPYDRGMERLDVVQHLIELVDDFLEGPAWGARALLNYLHRWCVTWAGPDRAEALLEAFIALREAMRFKAAALPGLSAIYGGVSMRYITRPLLFDTACLAPSEEHYFLRYVFNVSDEAARHDYLDQHGSRLTPTAGPSRGEGNAAGDPRLWSVDELEQRFESVAATFDSLADAPLGPLLQRSALGIRLYVSILRSCAAFYAAGILRNRHLSARRDGDQHIASIDPWIGHPDLLVFNELMRDELDNATRFRRLLEQGGMDLLIHAHGPVEEDTFVLGANLIEQIQTKCRLMRRHWLDVQRILPTPNR